MICSSWLGSASLRLEVVCAPGTVGNDIPFNADAAGPFDPNFDRMLFEYRARKIYSGAGEDKGCG
jgi:hypothetical protein